MSRPISTIKGNDAIFVALSQRKKELKLTYQEIRDQAYGLSGIKIPMQSLSKYFSRKGVTSLTEQNILWMCDRYGVHVGIIVEKMPYVEFEALLKIKTKYPNGKQ